MKWNVEFYSDFESEFDSLNESVQDECLAYLKLLAEFGPYLKRPHVDTLNGSKHANMKELRFDANDGVWRIASKRKAILLVGGDKSGISSKSFYKKLIKKADERFDKHLSTTSK